MSPKAGSPAATAKPVEVAKPEPPTTFSLFDAPAAEPPVAEDVDEEEEILAEAAEGQQAEEDEEFDEAA